MKIIYLYHAYAFNNKELNFYLKIEYKKLKNKIKK